MIVSPLEWNEIGQPVRVRDIEIAISKVLSEISCDCLAFSGGLDSSLMLYFMLQRHKRVRTFTIGFPEDHPDLLHAQIVADSLGNVVLDNYYVPTREEIEAEKQPGDFEGDAAVRLFYRFVAGETPEIIACDGIDEYMAGYYMHQDCITEGTYYGIIRDLRRNHLLPLNANSGKVDVYLPYLDSRLISLYSQIPLSEKIDEETRKKFMVSMARGKIPDEIITRRKYGFCDALKVKEERHASVA